MAKNVMKSQKPRANGRYQQGYYRPANPEKVAGDVMNLIYRSSWELKFMQFCDYSPNILEWANEPRPIPYYDPLSKKYRDYYVDFAIVTQATDGTSVKWLVEIKPSKQIVAPKTPERMTDKQTENFLYNAKQYIVNQAKFEAAKAFAIERGFRFGIITENFIFKTP